MRASSRPLQIRHRHPLTLIHIALPSHANPAQLTHLSPLTLHLTHVAGHRQITITLNLELLTHTRTHVHDSQELTFPTRDLIAESLNHPVRPINYGLRPRNSTQPVAPSRLAHTNGKRPAASARSRRRHT